VGQCLCNENTVFIYKYETQSVCLYRRDAIFLNASASILCVLWVGHLSRLPQGTFLLFLFNCSACCLIRIINIPGAELTHVQSGKPPGGMPPYLQLNNCLIFEAAMANNNKNRFNLILPCFDK